MSVRTYLFSLYASTLLALVVWLSILFYVDPSTADPVTTIVFFLSFLLWLAGFLAFILFQIKIQLSNREIIYTHWPSSLRQAGLISMAVTSLAVLRNLGTLEWWTAILVVLIFLLLELFFQSNRSYSSKD